MRSTKFLIDALRSYGEALDAGAETTQEEINALDEALASLQLKLTALADERDPAGNSQAGADAADREADPHYPANECIEMHCHGAGADHRYGDPQCDWKLVNGEVLPKHDGHPPTWPFQNRD